jgi:hypothetical protein
MLFHRRRMDAGTDAAHFGSSDEVVAARSAFSDFVLFHHRVESVLQSPAMPPVPQHQHGFEQPSIWQKSECPSFMSQLGNVLNSLQ